MGTYNKAHHEHIRVYKRQQYRDKRKTIPKTLDDKLASRIYSFKHKKGKLNTDNFTLEDFKEKFKNPRCYLTGQSIDLSELSSYHFDHIIPISKGGLSNLDNLGLLLVKINLFKSNFDVSDLITFSQQIILHYSSASDEMNYPPDM